MYDRLLDLATRPMPFACTTTRELWTDPHIATQMLAFHLDGSHDLASRRTGSPAEEAMAAALAGHAHQLKDGSAAMLSNFLKY